MKTPEELELEIQNLEYEIQQLKSQDSIHDSYFEQISQMLRVIETDTQDTKNGLASCSGDYNIGLNRNGFGGWNFFLNEIMPFKMEKVSSTSFVVWVGSWTQDGKTTVLTCDGGKNYLTVTGLSASTTYKAYLLLDDVPYASTLTVLLDGTGSSDLAYLSERYKPLGVVVTDSDGVITSITQTWKGGNIGETSAVRRLRLDYQSPTLMVLRAGTYTCNGTVFNIAETDIAQDIDEDGVATDWIAQQYTHYVYLYKYNSNPYADPTLGPEGIRVVSSSSFPGDTAMRQQRILLGTYTTNAAKNVTSFTRRWVNDEDELTIVPDGSLNPVPMVSVKTLEFNADGQYEMQMVNASDTTLATSQAWTEIWGIPSLYKDASGEGDLGWNGLDAENTAGQKSIEIISNLWQLYGMDEAGEASASNIDGWEFVFRTAQAGEIRYGEWDAVIEAIGDDPNFEYGHMLEEHSDYMFGGQAKATGRVLTAVDTSDWEWKDIEDLADDRYWPNTTYANPDTHDYKTSGVVEAGSGQTYIATIGDAANTRAGYFTDGTRWALLSGNSSGTDYAAVFYNGSNRQVWLCDANKAVAAQDGASNLVEICDGTRAINVATGDYYYQNNKVNWASIGDLPPGALVAYYTP